MISRFPVFTVGNISWLHVHQSKHLCRPGGIYSMVWFVHIYRQGFKFHRSCSFESRVIKLASVFWNGKVVMLDNKYLVVQSAISVRRRKLTKSKQVDLSFVKCRRGKRFRRTGCLIFCVWIELFWEPCFLAAMYSFYQTWQFWVKFRYTYDFLFLRNRNIFLSLVGGLEDKK